MGTSHACSATLSTPALQQATTDSCLHQRFLHTSEQVWVSLLCGHAPFSWVLVHTVVCLCPPRVYFPVLCKFWQLCDGVNGDLLQEGLCHTQSCRTQSPCLCSPTLLTCTSAGDTQTQVCPTPCGVSGSWCAQGLFEPSERLWWEWGLILNMNLPLLLCCWGFSLTSFKSFRKMTQ